jgi:DNA-binding NarL/FixJ family response regulator
LARVTAKRTLLLYPDSHISSPIVRCLLAEPQALVRAGISRLVGDLGDVTVVEAGSMTDALVAARGDLDLALLDVGLPGGEGLSGLRTLRPIQVDLPIVLLAADIPGGFVGEAVRAGAQGVIPKSASPRLFSAALRFVLDSGSPYLPLDVLKGPESVAAPAMAEPELEPAPVPDERRNAAPGADNRLTARQKDVLALVALGRSNREIGEALGIAEGTAKLHVAGVLKALGVQNRTEAALLARRMGVPA